MEQIQTMRQWRLDVQRATIKACDEYYYVCEKNNKRVTLDESRMKAELEKMKFYKDLTKLVIEDVNERQDPPNVTVVNEDCLLEALKLKKEGYNPIVLNMASAVNPGGGYLNGAGAQEENLFRRTNLSQYLESKRDQYPIPDIGGIYCPNAVVIRDSEQNGYEFLEVPEEMSFVAVAAIRKPRQFTNAEGLVTLYGRDKVLTRRKIRNILNIGLANGHDAIVLSAFGCGAYANPPKTIARLFYEVISNEYAGHDENNRRRIYKHISFAIFDDKNANKKHNPDGNLYPFEKAFENGIAADWVPFIKDAPYQPKDQRDDRRDNERRSYSSVTSSSSRFSSYPTENRGWGKRREEKPRREERSWRQTTLDEYKPSKELVERVAEIGFPDRIAEKALRKSKGNLRDAVNSLTDGNADSELESMETDETPPEDVQEGSPSNMDVGEEV